MNPLLLTLALLHGGDIATTQIVLRQGGREVNPVVPKGATLNLLAGSAATAANVYLLHRLDAKHPKLAKTIAVIGIGLEGFVVVHNARQVR